MNLRSLPDKLHELLEVALNDLILCEQDPTYSVNMGWWHEKDPYVNPDVCLVCLAGTVIAKTLNVHPDVPVSLALGNSPFNSDTSQKLKRLDSLQSGFLNDFFDHELTVAQVEMRYMQLFGHPIEIPSYSPSTKNEFHTVLSRLVRVLKEMDL